MSECQHDFYYSDTCSRCGESATDLVKELEQENARLRERVGWYRERWLDASEALEAIERPRPDEPEKKKPHRSEA